MRRIQVLVVPILAAIALAGCPAKPKNGECKSSTDCASQTGFGKVCVEGRCQECAADTDCKDGFVCKNNACTPRPQCASDADCPSGQACQAGACVAKPESSSKVETPAEPAVSAACADAAAFSVYFGFDQATLTGDAQSNLQKLADCLKKTPAKKVTVAGHCDERGTTQYNLALGGRRAQAAKKYLADLGAGGQIETVSYGKERPTCTESNEGCWAKNRRDEFQISR